MKPILRLLPFFFLLVSCGIPENDPLKVSFVNPPDSARPGVYWYFMDGNTDREGITHDLESMKEAGIGYVLFLEVNVGVPRGKVDFLSDEWQDLYAHAVREAERLGIRIILGSGPGWAGSGGPWVKPEQSMMHLVASTIEVKGPSKFTGRIPVPAPRTPFFGEGALTPELKKIRDAWYEDVALFAYPTPSGNQKISDVDEKALYYRAPYTSQRGVKQFIPMPAEYPEMKNAAVDPSKMIDLTGKINPDGTLDWQVPPGRWTLMRLGTRNNGAVTRPAPQPGLGFEVDKWDTTAFDAHFDAFIGKLLKKVGKRTSENGGGWTMIHIDSWEMGAQNWTGHFREEFRKRRGYDPWLYLPAYTGQVVGSPEITERFLWDLRETGNELILDYHAQHFKDLGRKFGFRLSIEPYDMDPTADLDLGSIADVPMCEFWTDSMGFNSSFSCIESTSIGHVQGKPVIAAEAFTAGGSEGWKKYPTNMKNQGDWAFAMGINRFVYHTFAHKPYGDRLRPGVTMGPYGVHWDRGQSWWPMVSAYHKYVTRCQFLLSQGKPVADILYLTPEGAPFVFRAPQDAITGTPTLPDKREYSFDGCSPRLLMNATVDDQHRIVFPGGGTYQVLVLPDVPTMTPGLLRKIATLANTGARIMGAPPVKSPSLVNYPACDQEVKRLADSLWNNHLIVMAKAKGDTWQTESGHMITEMYPPFNSITALLQANGIFPDFLPLAHVRHNHIRLDDRDIYFVSNATGVPLEENLWFRDGTQWAELWDAVTGEIRPLNGLKLNEGGVSLPAKFTPTQSFFIVFYHQQPAGFHTDATIPDFPDETTLKTLEGPWTLSFDTAWGGPREIVFDTLGDWSLRPEEGIRYYSGIATYKKTFDLPGRSGSGNGRLVINLGKVHDMARVRVNGHDLGVVWTDPWEVDITRYAKKKGNRLEIDIANRWANRLIGDENLPDDGVKDGKWPDWVLNGTPRPTKRYTFTPNHYYKKGDKLFPSGLIGPVTVGRRK